MNRETKFRGKSKNTDNQEMVYGWGCYRDENDRVFILTDEPVMNPIQVEEIQESTGLKDKNGKEIYEGDIVKDETQDGGITEVFWNAAGFEIWRSWDEINGRYEGIRFGYWVPEAMAKVEVIGNIYESKHLLDNTETKA